jgi:hypothetical protein
MAELIAGHMRIAFSILQDRECLRSGYPSEPLLAGAVACQMHQFQVSDPNTNEMATIFRDNEARLSLTRM